MSSSSNPIPSLEKIFTGHSGYAYCVYFSPDQTKLSSVGSDGKVHVWDLQSLKKLAEFNAHDKKIYTLCYSRNGKMLATGSLDNTVRVFDCDTKKNLMSLGGFTNYVRCVEFSGHDPNLLFSGSSDGTIKIWDVEREKLTSNLEPKKGRVYDIDVHEFNSNLFSSVHFNDVAKLWDIRTEKCIHTFPHPHYPLSVKFHPSRSKTIFATGCGNGSTYIFDLRTFKQIKMYREHTTWVRSISFHPSGDFLISCSDDKTINTYDLVEEKHLYSLKEPHTNSVLFVQFSKDGKHFVSASWDSRIILWKSNILWSGRKGDYEQKDQQERIEFLWENIKEKENENINGKKKSDSNLWNLFSVKIHLDSFDISKILLLK